MKLQNSWKVLKKCTEVAINKCSTKLYCAGFLVTLVNLFTATQTKKNILITRKNKKNDFNVTKNYLYFQRLT